MEIYERSPTLFSESVCEGRYQEEVIYKSRSIRSVSYWARGNNEKRVKRLSRG